MTQPLPDDAPPETLPDLLRPGLDIVFVGINPSLYSVAQGHYFARRANRFWPALSRSQLSAPIRRAMGLEGLAAEHDTLLLEHGIGFTDVVKRPTANVGGLAPAEFAAAAPRLRATLERYRPRIACFQGLTGYRPFLRAIDPAAAPPALGLQAQRIGATHLFVVPSPSPANAHVTPAEQTGWYDRLAECLAALGHAERAGADQ